MITDHLFRIAFAYIFISCSLKSDLFTKAHEAIKTSSSSSNNENSDINHFIRQIKGIKKDTRVSKQHYNIFTGRTTQTIKKLTKKKKTKKSKKKSPTKSNKKSKKSKKKSPTKSNKKSKKSKKNKKSLKLPKNIECQFDPPNVTITNYQDGKCDAVLNTPACFYDGGDCLDFNANYPSCNVSKPNWVGDNFCDGPEYNTTECAYDGGDCLEIIDFGCSGAGNGYCENIFNTAKCNWDNGDCAEFNKLYPHCKVPNPDYVGDGLCDDKEPYYTKECGWDGGDCDDFPIGCNATDKYIIGDGYCNLEWNTTDCEYDLGDCLCDWPYYTGGCDDDYYYH